MFRMLNAGFGEPLGAELLSTLRLKGVEGIRQDFQTVHDPQRMKDLSLEVRDAGLALAVICNSLDQPASLLPGTWAEWLNEPDGDIDPRAYADDARVFIDECTRAGVHPFIGVISNIDRNSLDWLAQVCPQLAGAVFGISAHHYAYGSNPTAPHTGFPSLAAQIDRLGNIAAGRDIFLSEFGFTTGPRRSSNWLKRLFGLTERWTDAQVAQFVRDRWALWESHGAVGAVLYQLNDGPTSDAEDRYGIRRTDGSWKPVADSFRR